MSAAVLAAALTALSACTTGRAGPAAARGQTLLLDLNTASRAQLRRLPGITDAYASRIINNRPYRVKHELETRKILPRAVYNGIRDKVTAREP